MRKLIFTVVIALLAVMIVSADNKAAQTKLRSAESIIENYYVDCVDADTLVEEAIRAMLKTLDPHSTYNTAEETRALEEPLEGSFSGIGVSYNLQTDTVIILQVIAGGPAERAGMLAGDRVISVNDTLIAGVKASIKTVRDHIRGPKGTTVTLTVERPGVSKPINFNIVRDDIPIYSVETFYMVPGTDVGYIRISRFAENTPREFAEAMERLSRRGMKNLIIDLQGNTGGYLTASTKVAENFLRRGDKIVFTQNYRSNPRYYVAESTGNFDGRVVVLVNQGSASASEILAGAIQDNDRGAIVGRRTFGKGLVQRPFRFDDGSMMRLTISRYHTPSGRCIQKPYTSGDDENYAHDLADRLNNGELTSADSIHFDESQLFYTSNGRPVYGGGGIMPDLFVPVDTTATTDYFRDLVAKGVLSKYVVTYLDANRKALKKKYNKKSDLFVEEFEVTPEMEADFQRFAQAEGVEPNDEQYALSRDFILGNIKGLIGRNMFDETVYYQVMNPLNPIFVEGVNLIVNPESYQKLLMAPEYR